ncbi:MAG: DUF350 domain-containing protein [Planctomycetota bacterium]
MNEFILNLAKNIALAVVWSVVGMLLLGSAFLVIKKACPFSILKEIEEDKNSSLGIVIGAVMLGIAIIVAAAIHG